MKPARPFAQRAALRLAALAAEVALAAALALVVHHARLDDAGAVSVCAVSARVDCNVVLRSRYAAVLGVPIAAWGTAIHVAVALMAITALLRRTPPDAADSVEVAPVEDRNAWRIAAIGLGAVGYSAWLFYVSHWRLGVTCLLCHSMYVAHVALAAAGLWAAAAGRSGPAAILRAEWRAIADRPRWTGAAAALLLVAAVAVPTLVRERRVRFLEASGYDQIIRGEWPRVPAESLPIEGRPSRGPLDAPVTIVEFADFECPFCADARFDLEDVAASFPVRIVFMNFPSGPCNPFSARAFHPNACLAAGAAEAAHRSGRFWEFLEATYTRPSDLRTPAGRARLEDAAGLPAGTFDGLRTDTAAWLAVRRDATVGAGAGVVSTPTFFVNGMGFAGMPPAWVLERIVREEVRRVEEGRVARGGRPRLVPDAPDR